MLGVNRLDGSCSTCKAMGQNSTTGRPEILYGLFSSILTLNRDISHQYQANQQKEDVEGSVKLGMRQELNRIFGV